MSAAYIEFFITLGVMALVMAGSAMTVQDLNKLNDNLGLTSHQKTIRAVNIASLTTVSVFVALMIVGFIRMEMAKGGTDRIRSILRSLRV